MDSSILVQMPTGRSVSMARIQVIALPTSTSSTAAENVVLFALAELDQPALIIEQIQTPGLLVQEGPLT